MILACVFMFAVDKIGDAQQASSTNTNHRFELGGEAGAQYVCSFFSVCLSTMKMYNCVTGTLVLFTKYTHDEFLCTWEYN